MFAYELFHEPISNPKTEFRVNFFNQVVAAISSTTVYAAKGASQSFWISVRISRNEKKNDIRKCSTGLDIGLADI